jgi:hypothetical protein
MKVIYFTYLTISSNFMFLCSQVQDQDVLPLVHRFKIFLVCVLRRRRSVSGLPPRWPGFEPMSNHVGFVVDKVALGQVFSEYFSFLCQLSFHQLLQTNLSSGAGTVGQIFNFF